MYEKAEKRIEMQLSPQEAKLIELIREIKYGRLEIVVKDGAPIRAENIRESIMLDGK